jgi:transposase
MQTVNNPTATVVNSVDAVAVLPKMSGGAALAQVRSAVDELRNAGRHDEAVEYSLSALAAVLQKSGELELLLAKIQRERVGKRGERIDQAQLALLLDELLRSSGAPDFDPEALAREDAQLTREIKDAEAAQDAPRKERRGSWRTNEKVTREVKVHAVPEAEKQCSRCGREKSALGHDEREILDFIPGHFVVREHRMEKYACGHCKDGVTTAAGPGDAVEQLSASASLLAHVVVSKFADHTPLKRLAGIYERSDITIPASTLSDWSAEVADRVSPVVEALEERVKGALVIGTDATGIKVLDPESAENIERGTMWCYVGDGRDVLFRYAPTGEGETGPWEFLRDRTGYVQADAASVFDRIFNGRVANAIEIGCWSHGRRRLVELQTTDCRAAYPVTLIARLYRIEHLADARNLSPGDRALLRKEKSLPVLEKLKASLAAGLLNEPPSSGLAKAGNYVLNHWTALTRFVDDGRLLLDNNITEQQMRSIALGRKNFLFAGSHAAAARAAVLYSLMRTCAQHRVAPLPYLADVLIKLQAGVPAPELLPDRWREQCATN